MVSFISRYKKVQHVSLDLQLPKSTKFSHSSAQEGNDKKRSVTKSIAFPDISQQYKTGSVHLWVQTSQSVRGVLKLCTEPVFSKSKCWEPKPTKASHWSSKMQVFLPEYLSKEFRCVMETAIQSMRLKQLGMKSL